MKNILKIVSAIFFINIAQAQTILIPNGGFNIDTSGWNIVGINTSIGGVGQLNINVSGIYTRDFVVTSPQFNLDANKTYKLHSDYRNVQYDPVLMMEVELGGFSNIYLKDSNGNTVSSLGLSTCTTGYFNVCNSGNFNIPTSGMYYLEFEGQHDQYSEFDLDNVGFEEVIQNTFSGTVTLDVNNNGCVTSSTTVANFPIQLNETNSNTSYNVFTDTNGNFLIEAENITGNFVVQTNQSLYTSTPANYTNVISTGINSIINQDFCIVANTVANDLNISIIPTTQARPGFNTSYQIRYTNSGTTTLNGAVSLNFDNSKVSYLNASIAPDATTITSLSWNYVNLMPLETKYIDINFNVFTPPTVNNGDILSYTAAITPITGDYIPVNNTFTFNQITIGSYDPNDITILEGSLISTSQASDYLNIIIRFQNTGTASAINITVKNTLDTFLDWNTFQPIAASHNYNTIVNNSNEVNFVFDSINLPDSATDEPGSNGWVFYKIKPKNTFTLGDVISNIANIYFDYNLPIITNTATTQINNSLSLFENEGASSFSIYPNPSQGNITINTSEETYLHVFTITGKEISNQKLITGKNILTNLNLSNGVYFFMLINQHKYATKKITIKK